MSKRRPVITASFDGACQPFNPGGHMGLGWVIGEKVCCEYVPAAIGNSNNVAEYMALIHLLETIAEFPKPGNLSISGDSQLVIGQVLGDCTVKAGRMLPLRAEAASLIAKLATGGWTISLSWVDRTKNTRADEASTSALVERGIEIAQYHPAPGYSSRFREMAEALGISSVAFGRVLNALGLRDDGKMPTAKAIAEGYAQNRFDGFGTTIDWHVDKVSTAVAAFLANEGCAATAKIKLLKPKHDSVLAQHFCGHETAVGLRSTKKALAQLAESLCEDCLGGNKVLFSAECAEALALCEAGDTLVDAVETLIEDKRLRPGVFLACWGKWSHAKRENVLNKYRGTCEKPGLHPAVKAVFAELERLKQRAVDRFIRAARRA